MMTRIDDRDGIKILRISGDFNMDTTPELQKLCNKITADKEIKAVLIDFEKVEYVDSAAFACMINFMKDHMTLDIKIGIMNLRERDQDLMGILKLEEAIKTFDSEDEAIIRMTK